MNILCLHNDCAIERMPAVVYPDSLTAEQAEKRFQRMYNRLNKKLDPENFDYTQVVREAIKELGWQEATNVHHVDL